MSKTSANPEHVNTLFILYQQASSCESFIKQVRKCPEIQIGQSPLEWVYAALERQNEHTIFHAKGTAA